MDGGGIEDEDRRVDKVVILVEVEDSLDLAGWTSISSFIARFRLRDTTRGVRFVFIDVRLAVAALRLDVDEEEEDVRFRVMVSEVLFFVVVVDRVCRIGGDLILDLLLLCFMVL